MDRVNRFDILSARQETPVSVGRFMTL